METWQRNFVTRNKPFLIENISCTKQLLNFLTENQVLSSADDDTLRALRRSFEQTNELLNILQTRTGGYQKLAQGLFICKQKDALKTFLAGVPEVAGKDGLHYCGIQISAEHILLKWVLFEGTRMQLETLLNKVPDDGLKAIMAGNDTQDLLDFVLARQAVKVTERTTCNTVPCYRPRKLLIANKLKPDFFMDLTDDIFLIEHIKENELCSLAEQCTPVAQLLALQRVLGLYSLTSKSSVPVNKVTARFILLENPIHFWQIAQSTERNVHWILYNDGKYEYVRSDGKTGTHKVKKYLLETKMEVTEISFTLQYLNTDSRLPVVVFGSPGMGKTHFVKNLSAKLKSKRLSGNVIYLEMRKLVETFLKSGRSLSYAEICETISSIIAFGKVGAAIQMELFSNPGHNIDLFIDGFDEIHIENKELALEILKCINNQTTNVRLCVACRPHWASDLENALDTIGYEIAMFEETEHKFLILDHWRYNYEVESSNEVTHFAEICLNNLKRVMATDSQLISGIPLQCRILADVCYPALQNSLDPNGIHLDISDFKSTYQMYTQFFKMKLGNNLSSKGESMLNIHYKLALQEIFPAIFHDIAVNVSVENVLKFGILELGPTGKLHFSHRTFAEFLISSLVLDSLSYSGSQVLKPLEANKFLFETLFAVTAEKCYISYNGQQFSLFHYQDFQNSVIVYFLNNGLAERLSEVHLCSVQKYYQLSDFCKLLHLENYLCACSAQDSSALFKLFTLLNFVSFQEAEPDFSHNRKLKAFLASEDFHVFIPEIVESIKMLGSSQGVNWRMLLLTASKFSSLEIIRYLTLMRENMLGADISSNFAFTDGHITPLHVAVNRGNLQIFENFYKMFEGYISKLGFLLHACLFQSLSNDEDTLRDKEKILKILLQKYPEMLNNVDEVCGIPPILTDCSHLNLVKVLLCSGADVNAKCKDGENVAHKVAKYYSADLFHDFVELMLTDHKRILRKKNKLKNTPLHLALLQTDVLTGTLELLSKECGVDFNQKNLKGMTMLHTAVEGMRDTRVLQDIETLGGKITICSIDGHSVLCTALINNNVKAFTYFLPRVNKIGTRCCLKSIWCHAFDCTDSVQEQVVPLLANSSENVNTNVCNYVGDTDISGRGFINNFLIYKSPLALAMATDASPEIVRVLQKAGGVKYTVGSLVLSFLGWFWYILYTNVCFPVFLIFVLFAYFMLNENMLMSWRKSGCLTVYIMLCLVICFNLYQMIAWNVSASETGFYRTAFLIGSGYKNLKAVLKMKQ